MRRRRDFRVRVVGWRCAELGIGVVIGAVIIAVCVEDSGVLLFGGAGCMWRAKMRSLYADVRWMRGCWLSNLAASRTPKLRSKRTSPRPAANSVPHPSLPLKFPAFACHFFFLSSSTKTTNSNHRLCRPTLVVDSLALATPMDRSRAKCHF